MKIFTYQNNQTDLLQKLKVQAKKKHLNIIENQDKIQIFLTSESFKNGESDIPVIFRGKITERDDGIILKGHFIFGFYLYTLVIVAAIFILARFAWSAYNHQRDNMILCGIVSVALIIVVLIVNKKAKTAKEIIINFLADLSR